MNVEKKYTPIIRRTCVIGAKPSEFGKSTARRSRPRFLKCPTRWLTGATIFILHAKRTARTDDGRHPLVQVIPLRSRAAVGRRFERYFRQLFLDSPRAARQRALLVAHRLRCRLSIVVHTVEAFGCVRSVYGFLDRRLTRRRLASSRPRRRRVARRRLTRRSRKFKRTNVRANFAAREGLRVLYGCLLNKRGFLYRARISPKSYRAQISPKSTWLPPLPKPSPPQSLSRYRSASSSTCLGRFGRASRRCQTKGTCFRCQ